MKSLSIILSTLLLGAAVYAADYSSKSTDELLGMRGTLITMPERNELHTELMKRKKTMTKEQLGKFKTAAPENRGKKFKNQGQGQGMGQGKGMGGGMGGGKNR